MDLDPRARIDEIRSLFNDGHGSQAAAALADLWDQMADPAEPWRAMRASLVAGLLTRAAASGPEGRRRIEALRQAVARPQGPDPADHLAVREWSTLNIALGQADRTLSWLDRVESDPVALASLRPLAGFIPYILRQAGRWPDMARWFPNPVGAVRHAYAAAETWLRRIDADSQHLIPTIHAFARDRAALVYASMLASGRDGDALRAADAAAGLDPDPGRLRVGLIAAAIENAGQARQHQVEWLDASGDRSERALELREAVLAALSKPADPR